MSLKIRFANHTISHLLIMEAIRLGHFATGERTEGNQNLAKN